jgi:hypothetical protein
MTSNEGSRMQRNRKKGAIHQPRSKHTLTRRHRIICDRRPNQQIISGKSRAHRSTKASTALQEEKTIQRPRHAMRVNGICIKRIHVKCQTHARERRWLGGKLSKRSAQGFVGSGQPSGEALHLKKNAGHRASDLRAACTPRLRRRAVRGCLPHSPDGYTNHERARSPSRQSGSQGACQRAHIETPQQCQSAGEAAETT